MEGGLTMMSAIEWAFRWTMLCMLGFSLLVTLLVSIAAWKRERRGFRRNWGHNLEQHSSYFAGLHRVPPDDLIRSVNLNQFTDLPIEAMNLF
jgi:hypothetical protein